MNAKLKPLAEYLNSLTGPVDLKRLGVLLSEAHLELSDVSEYLHFGADTYKRNRVTGSEWYEMLVMCWRPGQSSTIHDHAGSSCGVRILTGVATEIRYQTTGGRSLEGTELVRPAGVNRYECPNRCLAYDREIHRISNETNKDLVTLHIYSPPLHMNTYEVDPTVSSQESLALR